ncbi:hypothetical protein FRC08_005831 [Ceratobasidium sp. 394]|nr:hypothetical protein FRC08_005831 [Ceratobasidium sp. 394]KAG9099683.1 hypothetical protein FS749_000687 [Ceratobasidium sp. UAMH 11750]
MAEYISEVDIIFVGGGTAACVAAGRLAAANPDLEILLVEQGPDNLNQPVIITPAMFLAHLVPESKNTLFWQGSESDAMRGRAPLVASGGALGGGSSINLMMYARASASDYDDWNTTGWGFKDLVPLLKKLETYHVAPGRDTHGYDGPINISYSNFYASIAPEYLDASVRKGVPLVEDLMDTKTGHGCQRLAKYIDPVTGHRQDAAHRYIHPQATNKSLHILTKTRVVRVVFDGTKATGVEVIANKAQVPDADQTPRIITACKLVVVSAGAIGSPVILQRSGIGCAKRLSELDIHAVADLPGVGRHYEDHSSSGATFHIADGLETLDGVINQEPGLMERYMAEFTKGQGLLTTNAIDAGSKIRPTPVELEEMGPAFQEVWKRFYEPAPDKPVVVQILINGFLGPPAAVSNGNRFMMIGNVQGYPISKGHVYITSTDPYAAPNFKTGFMDEQADVDVHIWAYKKCREIARRMPSFRGECAALHPKFPTGSAAACVRLDGPPPSEAEDLVYTPEDNAAIEEFIRQTTTTTWHSIGTIPMKPKEQGGCVDARLNVYGTTNLKVADLSILPSNVGANTNSTALLVGEKAAILIAEDLGLSLP